MSMFEAARMAVHGVLANRLRSFLTLLGISIGVASVIILVAVGRGSAVSVQKQIEGLGTNLLTIQSGGGGFGRRASSASTFTFLTTKDVKALEDKTVAPDIKSVTPVVSASSVTATRDVATVTPNTVAGTTPSYSEARKADVSEGAFITAADVQGHARVVVIGTTISTALFGGADALGQTIKLNGTSYTVEGVLKSKGSNGFQDQDSVVLLPLTTAQDTLVGHSGQLNQILVEANTPGSVTAAESEATSILTPNHSNTDGTAAFSVLNQASLLQTTSSSTHTFHRAARCRRSDLAARRRHRRDEHHARHGHRAHARDRDSKGNRRSQGRRARSVHDGSGPPLGARAASPALPSGWSAASSKSSASRPSSSRTPSRSRSASESPSASSSESTQQTEPRHCGRSTPFVTSRSKPT